MKLKVEEPPKVFRPITITLESQMEVDMLRAIVGRVSHGTSPKAGVVYSHRKFVSDIYRNLTAHFEKDSRHFIDDSLVAKCEEVTYD